MKKILLITVVIYFVLAPITYHPDNKLVLFWGSLNEGKVWNIYKYGQNHLANTDKPQFNYPPVHFILVKLQYLIAKPIGGEGYTEWLASPNANDAYQPSIFRYTLATKLPIVLVTLANGWLIYQVVKKYGRSENDASLAAALWWLNPIVLYSGVLMGQNDVLAILPFLLGWLFLDSKWILSAVCFGLAISVKNYPLIWMGLLVITQPVLNWFKKTAVIAGSCLIYGLTILPFLNNVVFQEAVLNSSINDRFFIASLNLGLGDRVLIIPMLLITVLIFAIYFSKRKLKIWSQALIVLIANLILLGFTHFHPQWFTWLVPFWSIWFVGQTKCNKMIEAITVSGLVLAAWLMIVLLFRDIYLYWGILSPMNPNLMNLPYISEYLSARGFDIDYMNNVAHSIVAGVALAGVVNLSHLCLLKESRDRKIAAKSILQQIKSKAVHFFKTKNLSWDHLKIGSTVLSLATPIILWFSAFFIINLIPTQQKFDNYEQLKFINAEYPLTASFQAQANYLNQIDLWLRNPGFNSQEILNLSVFDQNQQLIASQNYHGSNIGDPGKTRINIPIQPQSKDQRFTVELNKQNQAESILRVAVQEDGLAVDHYYRPPPFNLKSAFEQTSKRLSLMLAQLWLWYGLICVIIFLLFKTWLKPSNSKKISLIN